MLNASPEGEILKTPAGFWRRLAAGMSDFMLCLGLYALLYMGTAEYLTYLKIDLLFDLYWQVIPGFFIFLFIYSLFLEILPMRATVGKRIFRTRVYDRKGNPAGLVLSHSAQPGQAAHIAHGRHRLSPVRLPERPAHPA